MKLYHDEITTPVRDAASIVLLRDHADGLQVFFNEAPRFIGRTGRGLCVPRRQGG
ncbi:MAG: hypothetical protein V9E91_13045 [Burkholderiaceae bacterium]